MVCLKKDVFIDRPELRPRPKADTFAHYPPTIYKEVLEQF